MSNSPPHDITQTNRIKMFCWYMSNSPPHIGTRGQTLGVKQPDSAPGGLLIKRLKKKQISWKICENYQLPKLDLGNARMINRKWHCPAFDLLNLIPIQKQIEKILGGCENVGQKIALTRFDLGKASMVNLWNCCSSSSTTPFFSSASPFYRNLKIVLKSMFCLFVGVYNSYIQVRIICKKCFNVYFWTT